jgi:adenylate kinase
VTPASQQRTTSPPRGATAGLNVVVLGAPGAGKGTQARPLAAEHGLGYIATGDLLRKAVASSAPAGRTAQRYMDAGALVPDELVFGLLVEAIERHPAASGLILDGFPRTTTQAQTLDAELDALGRPRPLAILIDVPDDVLIGRLSGRRICAEHGHEYHLEYRPPARAGTCDLDGSALVRRDDDEPETIRRRLAVYHELTEPLVAHYEHQRRLRRVDGQGDPAEIRNRLAAVISGP